MDHYGHHRAALRKVPGANSEDLQEPHHPVPQCSRRTDRARCIGPEINVGHNLPIFRCRMSRQQPIIRPLAVLKTSCRVRTVVERAVTHFFVIRKTI